MLGDYCRILILGGTGEARKLATLIVKSLPKTAEVITSYAGKTQRKKDPPGKIREGGFGGVTGLSNFIYAESIDLIIDATHPFAVNISAHAAEAASQTGRPHLILRRPNWILPTSIQVTEVKSMSEAADQLVGQAERIFLSSGRQDLEAFSNLKEIWFLVRLITMPRTPLPLANYQIITGHPPFGKSLELSLLKDNYIETLVSKHSGGPIPSKISAAATLEIPIILLRQPDPPPGNKVSDMAGALAWVQENL